MNQVFGCASPTFPAPPVPSGDNAFAALRRSENEGAGQGARMQEDDTIARKKEGKNAEKNRQRSIPKCHWNKIASSNFIVRPHIQCS